jgi:hypothetical protein
MADGVCELSEEEWAGIMGEASAAFAEKLLKQRNPYVVYLIKVLWKYRNGLERRIAFDWIRKLREADGLAVPKTLDETIRTAFNQHNSRSSAFSFSPEDDIFYTPEGKNAGKWAVHQELARAWLKRKNFLAASATPAA